MNTEQSTIQFLNFVVKESHIVFDRLSNYKIDIDFSPRGIIHATISQFVLQLEVNIRDVDNAFHIELKTESTFSYPQDADIERYKETYFILNAPAIIFPYVRAYIGTLTALSGMPTLTLPTLNLSTIGEDLKNNISIAD